MECWSMEFWCMAPRRMAPRKTRNHDERLSHMVNHGELDPNASLQSALDVPGIVKPALARLGIVTIAQLAKFDVRELNQIQGVGHAKKTALVELIDKAQRIFATSSTEVV